MCIVPFYYFAVSVVEEFIAVLSSCLWRVGREGMESRSQQ